MNRQITPRIILIFTKKGSAASAIIEEKSVKLRKMKDAVRRSSTRSSASKGIR
jgi:hypothetical protein